MRISHVLRKFDPAQWGGTETCVHELTSALSARGHSLEVFAPEGPADDASRSMPGLRRYHAIVPFLASAARRQALRELAGNIFPLELGFQLGFDPAIDLVHVHTQGRVGGVVRAAMRWTGRPYVVSLHGPVAAQRGLVEADFARRQGDTIDLGKPFGALVGARRVLDDAARVIVYNEEERRALEPRLGARVVRLDHGVNTDHFAGGSREAARARWPALGDGPVALQLGRLSAQKNPWLALETFAAAAPPSWRLAFAGSESEPGVLRSLVALAARLSVTDRVSFLGNVPRDAVPDLLARADLMLLPSTHEAFGLVVLEAWAAGRAMLFPRHSGLADLAAALGPSASVVEDLAPESWARAFSALSHAATLRADAALAGHALTQRRYDWRAIGRTVEGVYTAVLEENRRAHRASHRPAQKASHA